MVPLVFKQLRTQNSVLRQSNIKGTARRCEMSVGTKPKNYCVTISLFIEVRNSYRERVV